MTDFEAAGDQIATALRGTFRRDVVEACAGTGSLHRSLSALGRRMRAHAWQAGRTRLDLARPVRRLDALTRREGFHALHDWDGTAHRVNPDIIPIDVLAYFARERPEGPCEPATLAILVDYYFLHLVALLSLRIWDAGDADSNLERLAGLLDDLQGAGGSGQRFAADAETLILIATCHYEPDERGYGLLLDRVRGLDRRHRLGIATGHAASLGCHLRFGFEATYGRDARLMRDDNLADYPWLCFAVATVVEEYARLAGGGAGAPGRDRLTEALWSGLSADPGAFAGAVPAGPPGLDRDVAAIRDFASDRDGLPIDEFERLRPSGTAYSPFAFFFNFSHNVVKGAVIDALLWAEPSPLALNDLLSGLPADPAASQAKATLATRLMGYARASPQRIRGRLAPVIVYDPSLGRQAFAGALRQIRTWVGQAEA